MKPARNSGSEFMKKPLKDPAPPIFRSILSIKACSSEKAVVYERMPKPEQGYVWLNRRLKVMLKRIILAWMHIV